MIFYFNIVRLSTDHLKEVEIVLADGSIVIANSNNNFSDLFWCVRGGGGNFGIVSKYIHNNIFILKIHSIFIIYLFRFTFSCFSLPSHCFGGNVSYLAPTISSAKHICRNFDNIIQVNFIFIIFI